MKIKRKDVYKNMKGFKKIINYGTDKLIDNFNIEDISIYTTGGYVENLVFDFKLNFSDKRFKIRLTYRVYEDRQETSASGMISMFDRQLNDIKNKNDKIKSLKGKLKELNDELKETEKEIKKLEKVGE